MEKLNKIVKRPRHTVSSLMSSLIFFCELVMFPPQYASTILILNWLIVESIVGFESRLRAGGKPRTENHYIHHHHS